MPIYEYECKDCGHVLEAWQNASDPPLDTCPSCSGCLQKIISMSAFHLKGGGWYADGYGNGNGKCSSKACAASQGSAAGCCPSSAKTESSGTNSAAPTST